MIFSLGLSTKINTRFRRRYALRDLRFSVRGVFDAVGRRRGINKSNSALGSSRRPRTEFFRKRRIVPFVSCLKTDGGMFSLLVPFVRKPSGSSVDAPDLKTISSLAPRSLVCPVPD
jgi:hypothetical protein